jgi:PIN domain nuclease of toxin-antitoxin system
VLPIELAELQVIAQLPFYHRDPFDRLLVAQAIVNNLSLISADKNLDRYNIQRLW